jgi:hypothetical protein
VQLPAHSRRGITMPISNGLRRLVQQADGIFGPGVGCTIPEEVEQHPQPLKGGCAPSSRDPLSLAMRPSLPSADFNFRFLPPTSP